ncbi:MAG: creatininase family protein [Candidatus Fermentibacteraceae bacterium]|nr:creatininase family protein [Candidatus Fermentibacteraceae bacterium]MBN2607918.1 creatininase family protein [Candidatus Fermentibacteraceae bacterium]
MQLAEALTGEVAKYLETRDTVMIPSGSLEQHWMAAPLGCDTIIPVRLCRAAGDRTGTAVAPAVSYGLSENHMGFAGTVSLRRETLSHITRDVVTSLYFHGFRKMLFISGHGGNRKPIEDGFEEASGECPGALMEYRLYRDLPGAVEKHRDLFCPDPGYHVTVTEVSMIWHLLGCEMPVFPRVKFPPEPSPGEVLGSKEWLERYPQGGAGSDLGFVSVEKGGVFFEFLVDSLCGYLGELEKDTVSPFESETT